MKISDYKINGYLIRVELGEYSDKGVYCYIFKKRPNVKRMIKEIREEVEKEYSKEVGEKRDVEDITLDVIEKEGGERAHIYSTFYARWTDRTCDVISPIEDIDVTIFKPKRRTTYIEDKCEEKEE